MSGESSGTPTVPKAIGSLARKQADVTRQGTQKLKFVPTLPARRKKDAEVKAEPHPESEHGRGRARGRGADSRGRGTTTLTRTPTEMTASGPFAMGPTMVGASGRRVGQHTPVVPQPTASSSSVLGSGLSRSAAPSLKKSGKEENDSGTTTPKDEDEVYSEPDEGIEIVDMENVRQMDWMAPDTLSKEKHPVKNQRTRINKEESPSRSVDWKGKGREADADTTKIKEPGTAKVLDLGESDDEEFEDLIEDFPTQPDLRQDADTRKERLYFFQFPSPFPHFVPSGTLPDDFTMDLDATDGPETKTKKVSFAMDTTAGGSVEAEAEPATKLDGVIGQLEIYRSGAVKMRIGDNILYDVTAATQPSFLQHAVHLDILNKRLSVLGEISKQFVVSPNVDALLSAMEEADRSSNAVKQAEES